MQRTPRSRLGCILFTTGAGSLIRSIVRRLRTRMKKLIILSRNARCHAMRSALARNFWFSFVAVTMATGCTSVTAPKDSRPAVALQLQQSLVLSASRYASILEAMDEGRLAETKADIDWWIDQAIIELQWLEERHLDCDWGAVQSKDSPLPMGTFYRKLAHFRRDHSRQHSIPLEANSFGLIERFVKKYQ
jgi:hypothetical protein